MEHTLTCKIQICKHSNTDTCDGCGCGTTDSTEDYSADNLKLALCLADDF